jgi:uncharacterized protein involved in exopolysaccharide biosynthesis
MRRPLAIGCAAVVSLALILFALGRGPYYETSALVYVQPMKSKLITDPTNGSYDPTQYDTYIQQQRQTILRPDTLKKALQIAGPGAWSGPNESEDSAVARLQKQLKVERDMGSYQLSITLDGGNPFAIAKVVNAVTDAYIENERVDERAQSDQQLNLLKDERVRILSDLDAKRQEQAQLSTNLGVADTAGEAGNPYDVQLGEQRTQLAAARSAYAIAQAQLASVSGKGANLSAAAEQNSATDPGLNALKATISQRLSTLATQMAGLTPQNPLYKQDEDEMKRLNQSLDSMSHDLLNKNGQQLEEKYKLEVARTGDIVARLTSQLQQQTAIATGATPKLQRAAALAADITRLQTRFSDVDNAISTLELEHDSSGLVHLLLRAVPPVKPLASKKILILAGAVPFGICFGLGLVFLLHLIDPRVYIGDDLTTVLQFPPMAVLPSPNDVDPKVLDEFMLRLVAGMDQAHSSGGARTYVFSAVSANTNITDLVSSLAVKMDRLGYRTMILKASAALQNLSHGNDETPKPWTDTRLAKQSENRMTHLRRESFVVENLERLKQNVDLLFIEALPLLSSAEAEFAARLADVTVLVSESALTTRRELSNSLALARRLNVPGVAAVLTNVGLQHADEEFIATIRSVEGRLSEIRRRDEASAQRNREKFPLSIYESAESVSEDNQTSAQL